MKGRLLVLDKWQGRGAAALLQDGVLEELMIDPDDEAPLLGAIYRGKADRLVKGQGGVFVALPDGQSGFLRQTSGIAPGQMLLAQVTGPAEAGKAIPLTTRLLFKSRYAIVTPDAPGLNISRRIRDSEARDQLESIAAQMMQGAHESLGLILRSACLGALVDGAEDAVAEDVAAMRALAEAVLADTAGPPELLVDGPMAHDLAERDWTDPLPDEVDPAEGSFEAHGIDVMVDALLRSDVALPMGASMVIETTKALVAVDVNTGPDTSPAAALKANIAAARALPRELLLRGLGGQIVIDFAPISKKDRGTLDQVMKAAFKAQGSDAHLAGWTTLGLYEMTRKRDRIPLSQIVAGKSRHSVLK